MNVKVEELLMIQLVCAKSLYIHPPWSISGIHDPPNDYCTSLPMVLGCRRAAFCIACVRFLVSSRLLVLQSRVAGVVLVFIGYSQVSLIFRIT